MTEFNGMILDMPQMTIDKPITIPKVRRHPNFYHRHELAIWLIIVGALIVALSQVSVLDLAYNLSTPLIKYIP